MKHVFVFNPKSFPDKSRMDSIVDNIGQFFRRQERPHFSILVSLFPRDAVGGVRKEVKNAEEGETVRVYAVGGDGILFDCLNGIMGLPDTELASVPYGSSNDFIRAFGEGKADLFRNITALTSAKTLQTDVMAFGSNYAINTCTIGLESLSVIKMSKFARQHHSFLNRLSFLYGPMLFMESLVSQFDQQVINQPYDIVIDSIDFSGKFSTINIANGPCYGGTKSVAPMARPDDGFLNVTLFKSIGSIRTTLVMPSYLKGKTPSNCKVIRAKKVELHSKSPLQMQMDGEIFFDTDITIEIKPAAVQFVAADELTYDKKPVKSTKKE
jgi:YegS/Rv2252/BmrU family lipid kinase